MKMRLYIGCEKMIREYMFVDVLLLNIEVIEGGILVTFIDKNEQIGNVVLSGCKNDNPILLYDEE